MLSDPSAPRGEIRDAEWRTLDPSHARDDDRRFRWRLAAVCVGIPVAFWLAFAWWIGLRWDDIGVVLSRGWW